MPYCKGVYSVVCGKATIIITIATVHPVDCNTVGSSIDIIWWMHQCTTQERFVFLVHWIRVINQLWHLWRYLPDSSNTYIPLLIFCSFISRFLLTFTTPFSSIGSAVDANFSGIAESQVPAAHPAPVCLIHRTTLYSNIFVSSRRNAASDILTLLQ